MKKLLCIILATAVLGAVAGCGADASAETDSGASGPIAQVLSAELFTDASTAADEDEDEDDAETVYVDLEEVSGIYEIMAAGKYEFSGSLEGQIYINAGDEDKVQLVLNGVEITSPSGAAIYAVNADKVSISAKSGSVNTLSCPNDFIQTDENTVDAAIFAKCDLVIKGKGTLNIDCACGHGIVSKDDLTVKNCTLNIVSAKKCLSGNDSVTIESGTLSLTSGGDAIGSDGDTVISGGEITASAAKKGIDSELSATVEGGTLTVTKSTEGIEAETITISGGMTNITASDDGINAAVSNSEFNGGAMNRGGFGGGSNANITISGGTLIINAGGDGVDSNGTLTVTGGETYVSGPTNSSNGAIDYETEGSISGGIVVACGASGMAESFGSSSTQGSILYNFGTNYEAGTKVTLKDSSGTVLAEYTPESSFSSAVISAPEVVSGGTYTITAGSDEYTVEMTSITYSNSGFGGGMGGMGGGHGMNGGGRADMEVEGQAQGMNDGSMGGRRTGGEGFGGGMGRREMT